MTSYVLATRSPTGAFVLKTKSDGTPEIFNRDGIRREVEMAGERVGTANVMVFEKVPIATKVNISLPPDLEHSKR